MEEVAITKLLFLLDRKTGEKKKARFVKQVSSLSSTEVSNEVNFY